MHVPITKEGIMRPAATPYIALVYGIVVIMLGYMGWKSVGSIASFVMGGIFGLLTVIGSLLMIQGKKWAEWVTFAFVVLLIVTFVVRFYLTHGFIPAAMSLFSALLIVLILLRILNLPIDKSGRSRM